MELAPYVTAESVRAALGVSATELSNDSLEHQLLGLSLLADLDETFPSHGTLHERQSESDVSTSEVQQYRLLKLYSLYYCAFEAANNWLAFLKSIDDGKSAVTRTVNAEVLSGMVDHMKSTRDYWRLKLRSAGQRQEVGSTAPGLISVSSPTTDPVTNS